MLFDHFMGGGFGAVESEDGRSWLAITEQLQLPPGVRHASVLTIDAAHAAHLLHWLADGRTPRLRQPHETG